MDVRCQRCGTDYRLDEGRITEGGVSVRCTHCGHVFVVHKEVAAVIDSLRERADTRTGSQSPEVREPAWRERAQPWKVRQPNGNLITIKELTTLQKWIVERKLSRDDEISLTGETWKRLGSISELASFFQVVAQAEQAARLLEQPFRDLDRSPPQLTFAPAKGPVEPKSKAADPARAAAPLEDFPLPTSGEVIPAPRFEASDLSGIQPGVAEPPFTRGLSDIGSAHDSIEMMSEALRRRRRTGLSIVFLLLVLGAVTYLAYQYFVWVPGQRQAQLDDGDRQSPTPAPPKRSDREPIELQASSEKAAAPSPVEATPLGAEPAGAPVEASPPEAPGEKTDIAALTLMAPDSRAGVTSAERSKTDAVADFDSYLNKADRLRERKQPRAALEAYARASELQPARPEPLAGRGLALLDLGRTAPAIATLEQALEIDPRYGLAMMGLARAYRAEGKKEQAVRYYEKYLAVLPNGPKAQVAKAEIKALQE